MKRAGQILDYWFEGWKWRLRAKATWFTPDFVVQWPDGTLEVREIKGFMEGDAWLKLKLFAALYPIHVKVIRRVKREWMEEVVEGSEPTAPPPTAAGSPRIEPSPAPRWPD